MGEEYKEGKKETLQVTVLFIVYTAYLIFIVSFFLYITMVSPDFILSDDDRTLTQNSPEITNMVESSIKTENHVIVTTTEGDALQFKAINTPEDIAYPIPAGSQITYKQHPDNLTKYNILKAVSTEKEGKEVNE